MSDVSPRIPFLDLGRRTRALAPELGAALERVLESGRVLGGERTEAFERAWAASCGRRRAVAVASGTEALRLAMLGLEIGAGDEVIVPAFTAVPTIAAVCATGATPVPVDVDGETAALDREAAAAAIGERTKAIVVVHLFGRPAALPDLGLPVIEDCAHAHGMRAAQRGVVAAYSFYPTKNLAGVGDGGAVVTDDEELAERVARLRMHGRGTDGRHLERATNARMSEIEAAALSVGLERLEADNARRGAIAAELRRAAPGLDWQADHADHVNHLCVIRVDERERFRRRLEFETAIHYPRALVDEPAYAAFERPPVDNAREWASRCLSLPCYPELTDSELERVCASLRSASAGARRPG